MVELSCLGAAFVDRTSISTLQEIIVVDFGSTHAGKRGEEESAEHNEVLTSQSAEESMFGEERPFILYLDQERL